MTKPVILTGLRANNDLHIGNYFGALLPIIDMARNHAHEYEINLFVPDLHSFTTPINHAELQANILRNIRLFVAAGLPLDDDNIHIYRQSYIPAHSELTWILNCFTGFGELSKMTQFRQKSFSAVHEPLLHRILSPVASEKKSFISRDNAKSVLSIFRRLQEATGSLSESARHALLKIEQDQIHLEPMEAHSLIREYQDKTQGISAKSSATVGLYDYPVLMAADMLLYDAKYVPVGDDQTQHLEFTRDIAERMNAKFGDLFVVPEPVKKQHEFFGKEQGLRIKNLVDPSKKMSKSSTTEKGIIFLSEDPESAAKKIRSATTDSFGRIDIDSQDQPGISNLLQLIALATGKPFEDVKAQYVGQEQYGPLKTDAATCISEFLHDFQTKLSQVDDTRPMDKLQADEKAMNNKANETLLRVQKAVGLR